MKKRIIVLLACMAIVSATSGCSKTPVESDISAIASDISEVTEPSMVVESIPSVLEFEQEPFSVAENTSSDMLDRVLSLADIQDGETLSDYESRLGAEPIDSGWVPNDNAIVFASDYNETMASMQQVNSGIYSFDFNYFVQEENSLIGNISLVNIDADDTGMISYYDHSALSVSFETDNIDLASEVYEGIISYVEEQTGSEVEDTRNEQEDGSFNGWYATCGNYYVGISGTEGSYFVGLEIPLR